VRHEDVDVDVRVVNENDIESIKKRDEAMTEKILKVLGAAERVVVIVGELHRKGVVERLKNKGMSVECLHFPC
jgi:pheromone shutdown protein TraB